MAQVQTKTNTATASTTIVLAFTNNNVADNLLILVSNDNAGILNNISGVTDTQGNTWARAVSSSDLAFVDTEVWYAAGCKVGANTVTVTFTIPVSSAAIIAEYSGVAARSPLDKTASSSELTGTSHTSGASAATTWPQELVIGGSATNDGTVSWTAGSGYGNLIQVVNATTGASAALEDKNVTATGAQTATFTTNNSDHAATCVATFNLAPTGSFLPLFD